MKVKERNIPTLETVHGEEIRQMEPVVEEETMDLQMTGVEEEMVDHPTMEMEEEMTDHQIPRVDHMMEITTWMPEKVKENWH